MTPMTLCAREIALDILARENRKIPAFGAGDPIARWISVVLDAARDPRLLTAVPGAAIEIMRRIEGGSASPSDRRVALAIHIGLAVHSIITDVVHASDPEGDATPEVLDLLARRAVADWLSGPGPGRIDEALSEVVPRVVRTLLTPGA